MEASVPAFSSRSTAVTDGNDDAVPDEASVGGSLHDPVSEAEMDALASQLLSLAPRMTQQQMARMASILRQAISSSDGMASPDGSPAVLHLATNLFGAGDGDSGSSSGKSSSGSSDFGGESHADDHDLGVHAQGDRASDLECTDCEDGGIASDEEAELRRLEGREPAGPARPRARYSAGLAHGRDIICDHCRRGGAFGSEGCMSQVMLTAPEVKDLVAQHQSYFRLWGSADPEEDHRSARHELYKAVVAWQFGADLGAEQRHKLPNCVEWQVRMLFPCLLCSASCDFLRNCERLGHYTGFKTAAESKEARGGTALVEMNPNASPAPGSGSARMSARGRGSRGGRGRSASRGRGRGRARGTRT